MAATKQRSTSKTAATRARTRSTASNGNRAGNGRAKAAAKPAAKRAAKSTRKTVASAKDTTGNAVSTVAETATGAAQTVGNAVKSIALPVGTAVLGAAGGVALGKTAFAGKKKVLGVKLPGQKGGGEKLAKSIGEASRQLGKIAMEVQEARRKASDVGKALS